MSIENNVELLDVDSSKISSSAKIFSGSRISGFDNGRVFKNRRPTPKSRNMEKKWVFLDFEKPGSLSS